MPLAIRGRNGDLDGSFNVCVSLVKKKIELWEIFKMLPPVNILLKSDQGVFILHFKLY